MLKKLFSRGHGHFLEMLSNYVDGVLPEAERIALEAHLQGCDSCTEELESLRATVQMLRRMPEVEAPRSFRIAPAAITAPTPPPERPVFLWTMRVSTALAVVAFTVMVAGNVTGLFEGGGGDGEQAADSPAASEPEPRDLMEESAATPTAIPAGIMQPTPEAMMESEPDMIPKSTPMMMAERTATPEPEAMMEPTAVPEEAREEPTATPKPQSNTVASSASDDSLKYETTISVTEPAPAATAMPEPTPTPAPTVTPRPRPTTAPMPSPTLYAQGNFRPHNGFQDEARSHTDARTLGVGFIRGGRRWKRGSAWADDRAGGAGRGPGHGNDLSHGEEASGGGVGGS